MSSALKPRDFPWFDYSRHTFSLGLTTGSHVLLSGHSASEYDAASGAIVVKGDMAAQARTAWAKIARILEAGGKSFADIVHVVEYVTAAGIENYDQACAVRQEAPAERSSAERANESARCVKDEVVATSAPAVSVVVVKGLLRPQALIEIEVEAGPATTSAADGLIYLSLPLARDQISGDVATQTRAIYQQATRILNSLGLGMQHVVKTVDYVSAAALPSYKDTAQVRREYFARSAPERSASEFPAATGIVMPRVAHSDALIQVEFVATRDGRVVVNPGFGRYSQLTYSPAVKAGNLLFISGMAALDPETGVALHEGNVVAQAGYVYGNLRRVLAAAGGGLEDLVRTVEYVTPAALAHYREVARVRASIMREPFPTSTGVVCETLPRPQFQIEIDALAILPNGA
ncbi:MAG: RidA family protein [Candidatus Binataceae bacterium]